MREKAELTHLLLVVDTEICDNSKDAKNQSYAEEVPRLVATALRLHPLHIFIINTGSSRDCGSIWSGVWDEIGLCTFYMI